MKLPLRVALIVIGLAAAGVAAYTGGLLLAPDKEAAGTLLTNPIDVGDLTLRAPGNRQVSLGDFDDTVTAVFFGYTRCPDVCPITMARLADAYRELGEPTDRLNVLMVTIDPGHDTPELTDEYARNFHEDFEGVSGSNEEIADAAAAFYVGYNDTATEVVHTDAVMLVDRSGKFRMLYTTDRLQYFTSDLQDILASSDW
ncbi:MAG TPA: SCO family protein [Deinococcales bacterium]|nr:SCO family protein [Deinococcales bacterium]